MRRLFFAAVLAALLLAPIAHAWTWPAPGPVLQPFRFDPEHPFGAGQHRGIDVGGAPDGQVRAPAVGIVTFAGSVPSSGKSVTITTADGYAVTLTHLGSIAVTKGAAVAEGDGVGTIGPSGDAEVPQPYVHLGVRIAEQPQGYLDPLTFLPARVDVPAELSPPAAPAEAVPASSPATAVAPAPDADPTTADAPDPVAAAALATEVDPVADPPSSTVAPPAPALPASSPAPAVADDPPVAATPAAADAGEQEAESAPDAPATTQPAEQPVAQPAAQPAADVTPVAVAADGTAAAAPVPAVAAADPTSNASDDAAGPDRAPASPAVAASAKQERSAGGAVSPAPSTSASRDLRGTRSAATVHPAAPEPLASDLRADAAVLQAASRQAGSPQRPAQPSPSRRVRSSNPVAGDARASTGAATAPKTVAAAPSAHSSHRGFSSCALLVAAASMAAVALAGLLGAARIMVRHGTRPQRTAEAEDPGCAGVAVCSGAPSPWSRGGLRRPVGRVRPLSPVEGRRRPHGERDGRARHAGDGGRRRGAEVLR